MNQKVAKSIDASSKDYVRSLERGLLVIRCFDRERSRLTLTEVASHTLLTRATARRFLYTLNALGYIETDGKFFWLSPKVLNLGYAYLISQPIVDLIKPYLKELSEAVGESCSVSVLDFPDVVYIARWLTHQIMSVSLNVGTRLPVFSTSMGRVLLSVKSDEEIDAFISSTKPEKLTRYTLTDPKAIKAEILQVRKAGYSIVNQELEIGLRSIAVPLKNKKGEVIAAINVSSQPGKISEKGLVREILPRLLKAAENITEIMPVDEL
jgi:IclR family transcriptional regulator, pca regulon regulatory protein